MELRVPGPGYLLWGDRALRCAVGRGGLTRHKREGDGASPTGRMALSRLYYRPDREPRPRTGLPVTALRPGDGWCDDPAHPDYNRAVRLPHPAHCETLWREDGVYDLVVELGFNDRPVIAGAGSAIFLHLARTDFSPTEGCVALARPGLARILSAARPGDHLVVGGG